MEEISNEEWTNLVCLFSVFLNLKYSSHSQVNIQIVQIFDSFHGTFSGILFVFLLILLGISLGWFLWESSRGFWRSLFLIVKKGSSMMQYEQYHGKGLSFSFRTGFPRCLHNQYVCIFHTGRTKLLSQYPWLRYCIFYKNFQRETWVWLLNSVGWLVRSDVDDKWMPVLLSYSYVKNSISAD